MQVRVQKRNIKKARKDFHKWLNKAQDSIELGIKRKGPKYQTAEPFYNERHGQTSAFWIENLSIFLLVDCDQTIN